MAIQVRRGQANKFDARKMVPGEWAVCLDTKEIYLCFSAGDVRRMATYEEMEQNIDNATEEVREMFTADVRAAIQAAQTAAASANTAATSASSAASRAGTAAASAASAATSANSAATAAQTAAQAASTAADRANGLADLVPADYADLVEEVDELNGVVFDEVPYEYQLTGSERAVIEARGTLAVDGSGVNLIINFGAVTPYYVYRLSVNSGEEYRIIGTFDPDSSTSVFAAVVSTDASIQAGGGVEIVPGFRTSESPYTVTIPEGGKRLYICSSSSPEIYRTQYTKVNKTVQQKDGYVQIEKGVSCNRKADSVIGDYSATFGQGCEASSLNAFACGERSRATGINAFAEGMTGNAGGEASHKEGALGYAKGRCSHVEGYNCLAEGENSHAEGSDTKASGQDSHAGGSHSEASGSCTFAHGSYVNASKANEVAFGSYNASGTGTVFSIGNGTAAGGRSNLFEIESDGSIYVNGKNTVEKYNLFNGGAQEGESVTVYNSSNVLRIEAYATSDSTADGIQYVVKGEIVVDMNRIPPGANYQVTLDSGNTVKVIRPIEEQGEPVSSYTVEIEKATSSIVVYVEPILF